MTLQKVESALPKLEHLAQQTIEKMGVPGIAIVVVFQDKVVYRKGFGVRIAGGHEPIDEHTIFQLASVSKPITSTVLAALVGEGVINWDDRVIDHDPNFRLFDSWVTREVTLRDLLCHRSGLPAFAGDILEDIGYPRMEILRRLRYLKPASSFRSRFAYTNFGYTAAAVAAARAAGKPWEDLVVEKLYQPLGMTSSSSRFSDFERAKNRAALHVPMDGGWASKYVRDPDTQSPAGGVSSNLLDLAQWMRLQLNNGTFNGNRIVSAEALDETHRPQIVTGFNPKANRASLYGLGWNVSYDEKGRVFWKHSGGFNLGMRTEVALLAAEHVGIATLSNASPTGVPEGLNQSFFDLILHGKIRKDWVELANRFFEKDMKASIGYATDYSHQPGTPSPALPATAYAGVYHNTYFGDLRVVEKNGSITLSLGPNPKKVQYPLRHWNRDMFVYQPVGESAGGLSGMTFSVGPDGKAETVVVENLNIHGQGSFTRVHKAK